MEGESNFEIGHRLMEELTEQELEELYQRDADLVKWKEQTAKWFTGFMRQWYDDHGFELTERDIKAIIRVVRTIRKKKEE